MGFAGEAGAQPWTVGLPLGPRRATAERATDRTVVVKSACFNLRSELRKSRIDKNSLHFSRFDLEKSWIWLKFNHRQKATGMNLTGYLQNLITSEKSVLNFQWPLYVKHWTFHFLNSCGMWPDCSLTLSLYIWNHKLNMGHTETKQSSCDGISLLP